MVLGSFGLEIEESELRALCNWTLSGTDALMTVDAARQLGFAGTEKHTLKVEELESLVAHGSYPIVFVDLRPIDGVKDIHALVVVEFTVQEIIVLDPLKGERALPLQSFNTAWGLRHNLAIIVKR